MENKYLLTIIIIGILIVSLMIFIFNDKQVALSPEENARADFKTGIFESLRGLSSFIIGILIITAIIIFIKFSFK